MCQDAAGASAILEKGAAVFLGGDSQTDGVFLQRDGTVAHDAVKTQAGDVQHVLRAKLYRAALRGGVGIGQFAAAVPVHLHAVGQERVQGEDMAFSAPDDLTIGVAPQEQVTERRFPPDKAGHLRVGLVVEQAVQRMIHGLLTAVGGGFIHAHWQTGDGFRDDTHAGVHRGHLHGVLGIHRLAGSRRRTSLPRIQRRGACPGRGIG